jgi:hypothetical protein
LFYGSQWAAHELQLGGTVITVHTNKTNNNEKGVALLVALLTLLLITAIGMGLIVMANTETSISANFRDEQTAFFSAKAGLEEVRDRMRAGANNSLNGNLPTALPGTANGILYVTNPIGAEVVAPWNSANAYADKELCKEVTCTNGIPAGNPWYLTASAGGSYAAVPPLTWKWARLTVKTNKTAAGTSYTSSVDGTASGNRVCWTGSNEITTANANCGANADVYVITSEAYTSSGSRRMAQMEAVRNLNVPVVAALFTKLSTDTGQALNITGNTDPVCNLPSTYGAASGTSTVTTPGQGNVTGSPAGTVNNYGWTINVPGLIASLQQNAVSITTVSGITGGNGNPPNYTLTNGALGTAPTVTYNGSQAITAITNPGTPVVYQTPSLTGTGSPAPVGTLTLGGSGSGVTGQGVLIVNGNLTLDVSHGFDYFGLIVVTGNMTMISSTNASVNPHIDGAVIVGGQFTAPISNFSGSISVHQNACMVNSALGPQYYRAVAVRELMY